MESTCILIVDDQQESIDLLKALLAGYLPDAEIMEASDGESALACMRERKPSLILLDVKMPGIDGFEVCRRVKAAPETADIPVLMVSGVMVGARYRVRGLNLGADGYICKPFEPPEFVAQVLSLLRLKTTTDALREHGRTLECEVVRQAGALRASEAKYRRLVEQLPAVTYVVDLDTPPRTVYISPQVESLLGFSPGEWFDDPHLWRHRLHPEDREAILAEMHRHDTEGDAFSLEYRMAARDGTVVWFRDEAAYLDEPETGRLSRHGVMLDITARKRAEAALRESEEKLQQAQKLEALGRLSGGVAHDFNNLLTTILGYGRMLAEEPLDEAIRADLAEIIRAGERAEDLTRRLLAFGHSQPAELLPVNLNDVVADMDRLLRRTLGEDVELVTLLDEDAGLIEADEGQLSQVLVNLAVNARNAMPGGGKLSIVTERVDLDEAFCADRGDLTPGGHVRIEISDTGCGMPPEVQARAFEPFFTTRGKGEGTGLGLSIVYGIIRQSHGHIELESRPGEGTRFRIYFPCIEAKRKADGAAPLDDPSPRGSETILVVEDETSVRRLTVRLLRGLGYRVLDARHGGDALRVFARAGSGIDLVLSDIVMPHMGGPEMVQRLHEIRDGLKVLFMTGFAQQSSILHDGKAYPNLPKPYSRKSLARAVRAALDVEAC